MNGAAQLTALESKVGFHEGANNDNPFGPWQGVRNAAWCDSFAQWGAVENGGFRWPQKCQFGEKGDAYTPWTVQHAKELALWREPSSTPEPHWQALFDWNHNGVADHIGTVVRVNRDGSFVTVEGNYHDQVAYVVRDRTYLLGFVALPVDNNQPVPVSAPVDEFRERVMAKQVLRLHSKGEDVKVMQSLLMKHAGDLTGNDFRAFVDGDFGSHTEQVLSEWQGRTGKLAADGVCGPATWAWLVGV